MSDGFFVACVAPRRVCRVRPALSHPAAHAATRAPRAHTLNAGCPPPRCPRIFTMEFCEKVLEECAHFEAWAKERGMFVHRPNSMNNFGTMLDDIGMSDMLQQLGVKFVGPLAARVLPECGGESVDSYVAGACVCPRRMAGRRVCACLRVCVCVPVSLRGACVHALPLSSARCACFQVVVFGTNGCGCVVPCPPQAPRFCCYV